MSSFVASGVPSRSRRDPAPGTALTAPGHLVVAVLDGGPDDAEVIDVAIEVCAAGRAVLKVVHVCAAAHEDPTPLDVAYGQNYVAGAVKVAQLVPGVHATARCLPHGTWSALRRELGSAELLVASADHVGELPIAAAPMGAELAVRAVRAGEPAPRHLRLTYRLALQRELARGSGRPDGATTPEDLDDAWRVGVAYPPLQAETISAWAACSAWPPRTAEQQLVGAF